MEQKYDVDELYLATIAPISINFGGDKIKKNKDEKFYSVVTKSFLNTYVDLISKKRYNYFDNVSFDNLKRNLDKFYIFKLKPMRKYLEKNIDYLTMSEIIAIYNEKNDIKEPDKQISIEESKELNTEPAETDTISDVLLREIVKTSKKIDDSINPSMKEDFINELISLGNEYISSLIRISQEDKKGLTLVDEKAKIQKLCIEKLADIEYRITSCKASMTKTTDLLEDLKKFNSQLEQRKSK